MSLTELILLKIRKQIITDIERAANKTIANRQIIQNDLAQAEDKEAVVKDIVTTIFSPNEAQQILKICQLKENRQRDCRPIVAAY